MSTGLIVLIVLIVLLFGVMPGWWPHSREWNYAPSGVVGLLAIILIVLLLTGRI